MMTVVLLALKVAQNTLQVRIEEPPTLKTLEVLDIQDTAQSSYYYSLIPPQNRLLQVPPKES